MIWLIITTICFLIGLIVGLHETHMQMVQLAVPPDHQGMVRRIVNPLTTIKRIIASQILLIIAIFIASMAGYNLGNGVPTTALYDGEYRLIGSTATNDRNFLLLSGVENPDKIRNIVASNSNLLLIKDVPADEVGKVWVIKGIVEIHLNTWTKDQFSDNILVKTKARFEAEKRAKQAAEAKKKAEEEANKKAEEAAKKKAEEDKGKAAKAAADKRKVEEEKKREADSRIKDEESKKAPRQDKRSKTKKTSEDSANLT
jgi:hypothetical protein